MRITLLLAVGILIALTSSAPTGVAPPALDGCFAVAVGGGHVFVEANTGWTGVYVYDGWPGLEGGSSCRLACAPGTVCIDCHQHDPCVAQG